MNPVISHSNYGKSKVRVLKVKRDTPIHEVTEMSLNIQLEGDFDDAHTKGDNRNVLPTDTMKNTVYVLAKENPVNSIEEFGLYLSDYFLKNNKQVAKVNVEIEEKLWNRIQTTDQRKPNTFIPHNHSFVSAGDERRTAKISFTKKGCFIQSGISGLLVLKTTGSGFENYIKDKFTTLKETSDRVFSTSVTAVWKYANQEVNYLKLNESIRQTILETFAEHNSLSVQQTLYETGKNVITKLKDISEISLSMPNKHYLPFNLEQFGLKNNNEIFIPTDEPFGLIEATIIREDF